MQFRNIPGHESEKQRLMAMVDNNTLPHALLLEGAPGRGKLALALATATYIHCENRIPGVDSCGECRSCRLHATLSHVDLLPSFPVVKRSDNPVSNDFMAEFRDFVAASHFADLERWTAILNRGKANTRPVIYVSESADLIKRLAVTTQASRFRIVVMWLPENLQDAAANKLLKLVEEPFPDTLFLMVSNNAAGILPTIYSRTQRIKVGALNDDVIAAWLVENRSLTPDDARVIANLAEGNMISACQLIETDSSRRQYFEMFKSLMRLAYLRDVGKLREWSTELADEGRDRNVKFYEFAMRMVRENFIYNFSIPQLVHLDNDESSFSRNFARFITENNVERIMATFEEGRTDIMANGNAKIVNFDVAIQTIFHIKNA